MSAPSDHAARPGTVTPATDDIVETIARLVHEVIGDDVDIELDIDAASSFSEDIELESIEFVALGERLQLTYGERIDLVGWFGELDLDEIIDLTVGELAEFIAACLAGDGPSSAHAAGGATSPGDAGA